MDTTETANKAAPAAPANKARTRTRKAPAAKTATAKAPALIKMTTPDGRAYSTTDADEAGHLNRTRGYTFTK